MMTVLITGANRGIGLEFCRQYKKAGKQVIAACRKSSPELEMLEVRVEEGVDVGSEQAVKQLAQRLKGVKIDILVNNAGILTSESLDDLNFAQIQKQFEINSLGPLRVTSTLLPNLHKGSKVAIITSRMGSITDNTSGSRYGYRMSKAAVNMAGASLAVDLKPQGISVAILHPGFVRTDMTAKQGLIDTNESAAGLIMRIQQLNLKNSGSFWHMNGEVLPW